MLCGASVGRGRLIDLLLFFPLGGRWIDLDSCIGVVLPPVPSVIDFILSVRACGTYASVTAGVGNSVCEWFRISRCGRAFACRWGGLVAVAGQGGVEPFYSQAGGFGMGGAFLPPGFCPGRTGHPDPNPWVKLRGGGSRLALHAWSSCQHAQIIDAKH